MIDRPDRGTGPHIDSRNLTQEDVAYEADVSIRHYQQLESGKMNPTLRTLFRIVRVLGVPPNTLLEGMAQRKR
jgi:transcriptional regulator with XRE-family HTH domain